MIYAYYLDKERCKGCGLCVSICLKHVLEISNKKQDTEAAMLRPQTLFPFPEEAIHDAAVKLSFKAVMSIEMSMGQMLEDVERSVRGKRTVKWYGKCGGEIPTPEEVIEVVQELVELKIAA